MKEKVTSFQDYLNEHGSTANSYGLAIDEKCLEKIFVTKSQFICRIDGYTFLTVYESDKTKLLNAIRPFCYKTALYDLDDTFQTVRYNNKKDTFEITSSENFVGNTPIRAINDIADKFEYFPNVMNWDVIIYQEKGDNKHWFVGIVDSFNKNFGIITFKCGMILNSTSSFSSLMNQKYLVEIRDLRKAFINWNMTNDDDVFSIFAMMQRYNITVVENGYDAWFQYSGCKGSVFGECKEEEKKEEKKEIKLKHGKLSNIKKGDLIYIYNESQRMSWTGYVKEVFDNRVVMECGFSYSDIYDNVLSSNKPFKVYVDENCSLYIKRIDDTDETLINRFNEFCESAGYTHVVDTETGVHAMVPRFVKCD